jgi:asparagine synthase (glutamine-hydrolysing)
MDDADVRHPLIKQDVVAALQSDGSDAPPWYLSDESIPPGKQRHIAAVVRPECYYDPFGIPGDPERLAPLVSQPLIELCLRIPTYVLTSGGWDRAVARRAFTAEVPAEILHRRSKGGIEEHSAAILKRNIKFIRHLLLDGELVRNGLLDRCKVESALSGRPSGVMKGMVKIFQYIGIEIWLNTWARRRVRAAGHSPVDVGVC